MLSDRQTVHALLEVNANLLRAELGFQEAMAESLLAGRDGKQVRADVQAALGQLRDSLDRQHNAVISLRGRLGAG